MAGHEDSGFGDGNNTANSSTLETVGDGNTTANSSTLETVETPPEKVALIQLARAPKFKSLDCHFSECQGKFKKYTDLLEHTKECHIGYDCDKCHMTFQNEKDMRLHYGNFYNVILYDIYKNIGVRHHHNAKYFCDLCHKACSTKINLNSHKNNNHKSGKKFRCSVKGCTRMYEDSITHLSE